MITLFAVLLACGHTRTDHGHTAHGEGGDSVAVTRWTDSHELFVELDAPVAGRALAYHAHVTRLADNHAVTSGTLTFRFEQDGFAIESHTDPDNAWSDGPTQLTPGDAVAVIILINRQARRSNLLSSCAFVPIIRHTIVIGVDRGGWISRERIIIIRHTIHIGVHRWHLSYHLPLPPNWYPICIVTHVNRDRERVIISLTRIDVVRHARRRYRTFRA